MFWQDKQNMKLWLICPKSEWRKSLGVYDGGGGGEGEGDGICRKNGKIHDSGSELDQHTKEKCIVVFMHNP